MRKCHILATEHHGGKSQFLSSDIIIEIHTVAAKYSWYIQCNLDYPDLVYPD